MTRKVLELQLLSLRFKHYTADVRQCISRIVSTERCKDTSDKVIDELWKTCPDEIDVLLAKSGIEQPHSVQDGSAPTCEAREFIRTFIDQALSYEAELGDLEDDDFEVLYRSIIDPIVKLRRERRAQAAQENDRWAFFNAAEADADFARWRDRLLNPAQAVALSFGKDPDVVTPKQLEPYRRVARSPFREAFKDWLDLIEAAVAAGELSVPMSVSAFVQWAKTRGLEPSPELSGKATESSEEDATFWKQKYEAAQTELDNLRKGIDELQPLSKASLFRMVLGMAITRFEHRTDQRSNATSAIRDELEKIGLALSDEAIRGHLTKAANELNIRWSEPIQWSRFRRTPS